MRNSYFEQSFPRYRCPCGHIIRFTNTFGEYCHKCNTDRTLDWRQYIIDEEVKAWWNDSSEDKGPTVTHKDYTLKDFEEALSKLRWKPTGDEMVYFYSDGSGEVVKRGHITENSVFSFNTIDDFIIYMKERKEEVETHK